MQRKILLLILSSSALFVLCSTNNNEDESEVRCSSSPHGLFLHTEDEDEVGQICQLEQLSKADRLAEELRRWIAGWKTELPSTFKG